MVTARAWVEPDHHHVLQRSERIEDKIWAHLFSLVDINSGDLRAIATEQPPNLQRDLRNGRRDDPMKSPKSRVKRA